MERSSSRRMSHQTSSGSSRKSGLLKHQLQLHKRQTPDGKERYEIAPIQETLSFEKGFFLFIRAVQLLAQKNEGVVLVGLAGPSGAGKSVFSEKVATFMPGIGVISMDNYNDASRVIDGNYDDPRLTDYDTLLANIQGLREGREVEVPIYDFKTSSRVGFRRVEVPQSRIIMVEGIYALSEKLRPLLDLRVSITGGVHFDLVKRVLRDINRSGQEPEDIIHQISETVYPMYKAFIEPDLQTAHIKIVNKFNPFSGFQNATYILKSAVTVTEEQIRAVLSPKLVESTEETYDIYLLPPGEDREACQSYLRMRNREGKYSLMFEEWVTDGPYIISPRITFEVSVRLLGGLMALGYEMASILKRVSRVFTDEEQHFTVKIDKLEQLQRTYVQVQGKDRQTIRSVAQKLGMEGHYVPRSYIEQIHLERLTTEVMAVPEELKERLGGGLEDLVVASPRFASSWADSSLPNFRNIHREKQGVLRSQSWQPDVRGPKKKSETGGDKKKEGDGRLEVKLEGGGRQEPDSPSAFADSALSTRLSEQLHGITDRLDELMSRLHELEARLPEKTPPGSMATTLRQASTNGGLPGGHYGGVGVVSPPLPIAGSWGSQAGSSLLTANGPISMQNGPTTGGFPSSYSTASNGGPAGDAASLADDVRQLVRGQRHMAAQLDVLSSIVRDSNGSSVQRNGSLAERSWWDGLVGNMRTGHAGLATAAILGVTGVAAVAALVALRARGSQ